jgi:D-hydroxyproline dehydrogenase subunit gamma
MDDTSLIGILIDGAGFQVMPFTTVAAAIALHGNRVSRRSVTGQARNVLCGMGVCQECRVTIDGHAHVLGCQTLCREGMLIETAS